MAIYLSREEVVFVREFVEMALNEPKLVAKFEAQFGTFGHEIVQTFSREAGNTVQCEVPGCPEIFSGHNKYSQRGVHEKTHKKEGG